MLRFRLHPVVGRHLAVIGDDPTRRSRASATGAERAPEDTGGGDLGEDAVRDHHVDDDEGGGPQRSALPPRTDVYPHESRAVFHDYPAGRAAAACRRAAPSSCSMHGGAVLPNRAPMHAAQLPRPAQVAALSAGRRALLHRLRAHHYYGLPSRSAGRPRRPDHVRCDGGVLTGVDVELPGRAAHALPAPDVLLRRRGPAAPAPTASATSSGGCAQGRAPVARLRDRAGGTRSPRAAPRGGQARPHGHAVSWRSTLSSTSARHEQYPNSARVLASATMATKPPPLPPERAAPPGRTRPRTRTRPTPIRTTRPPRRRGRARRGRRTRRPPPPPLPPPALPALPDRPEFPPPPELVAPWREAPRAETGGEMSRSSTAPTAASSTGC